MKAIIKTVLSVLALCTIFTSVCAASVSTDINKYNTATEKQFSVLEKQAAKDFNSCLRYSKTHSGWNVLEVSDSANFETCNVLYSYKISGKTISLINAKGQKSSTTFKELNKFEAHFFTNKNIKYITDGSLAGNLNQFKKSVDKKTTTKKVVKHCHKKAHKIIKPLNTTAKFENNITTKP
jgi:hypothetical protein